MSAVQQIQEDILALGKDPSGSIEPILKKILAADPPLKPSEIRPLLKRTATAKKCTIADVEDEYDALKPPSDDTTSKKYSAPIDPGIYEDATFATALERSNFLTACVVARQVEAGQRDRGEGEYSLTAMEEKIEEEHSEYRKAFERDKAFSEAVFHFRHQANTECERNSLGVIVHTDGAIYSQRVVTMGDDKCIVYTRISTPIVPTAAADAPDGGDWVRLFQVRTPRNTIEEVVISQSDFVKRGGWLKKLQEAGALVSDPDNTLLALQYAGAPKVVNTFNACGWQGDDVYVLPNGDILTPQGKTTDHVVNFQALPGYDPVGQSREAANDAIFKYCEGNPILVLTTCAALSAPFLRDMNVPGGGFHVHGDPGTGKTIATRVGTATTGSGARVTDGGAVHSWRSTDNGVEAEAKSVNDSVFPRDELHLCKPSTVAQIIYMLGDGEGKKTLTRNRERRDTFKFNNMVLSSGELSTKAHIESDPRQTYRTGSQARLSDIPVKPKADGGVFETLHGFANAKSLADHLETALLKHSGWHVRALVQRYLDNRDKLRDILKTRCDTFYSELVESHGLSSEDDASRVTRRFALVAAIGEIAIRLKYLPWTKGAAFAGVAACYKTWLVKQGGGNLLAVHGVDAFEHWLTRHKAAFEWTKDKGNPGADVDLEQRVFHQVGYRRVGEDKSLGGVGAYTEYIMDRKVLETAVGQAERCDAVLSYLKDGGHDKIDLIARHGHQSYAPKGTFPGRYCYILRVYEIGRRTREYGPQPAERESEYEM